MNEKIKLKDGAVYEYAAPFPGRVPGLPPKLTGKEAKDLGVEDILAAALENGNYREIPAAKKEK